MLVRRCSGVAGAEQHDIDPGLVADEAISRIDDAAGAASMHQKAERVGIVGEPRGIFALSAVRASCGEPLGARKDVAHREHQQRADPVAVVSGKTCVAGVLVHHVERDHRDVPHAVLGGAPHHFVLGIAGPGLGDAEMAELALLFLAAAAPGR